MCRGAHGGSKMGPVAEGMREKLESHLRPLELTIVDDSRKHAGHAGVEGLRGGETHFNIKVVSSTFENKPMITRHRLVYSILDVELREGVHALKLSTKTPAEAGL